MLTRKGKELTNMEKKQFAPFISSSFPETFLKNLTIEHEYNNKVFTSLLLHYMQDT